MFFSFDKPCLNLEDIASVLSKCNVIKFAAYRTAAKLRLIQKALYMEKVSLRIISCIFERHELRQTENSKHLSQKEVESVLFDMYFGMKKEKGVSLDIDFACILMFGFLKEVFAKDNSNTVQVFSFKVCLTLLCEAKPREKYHYLFEQLADHSNCISKKKLETLLRKMTMLIDYLGEGPVFGSDLISGTVESCFQCTANGLELFEDVFMNWLIQDPQLLVWLSTFYRMQISESVSHNAKCGICKTYPLVGFRYRCLRCLSYDMCQLCFFTGKLNKKHKLKHPIQEFCCPMTPQQSTKAFLLTLRNKLYKKKCKLQYLPALKGHSRSAAGSLDQSTRLLDELELSSKTVVNGSRVSLSRIPFKELQNIILQLERDNEKLIPQIDQLCLGAPDSKTNEWQTELKNCLMKHKIQVKSQVQRLKLLKNYLASKIEIDFQASTPLAYEIKSESRERELFEDLTNLSPIAVRRRNKGGIIDRENMLWDNHDLGTHGSVPSWEDVFTVKPENRESLELAGRGDGKEHEPTVWLAGKTLRELESSSKEGISWLCENVNEAYEVEKIRRENEETLQELQSDLKNILEKLQELSVVTSEEEGDGRDTTFGTNRDEVDVVEQMDSLFMDFLNGVEKLIQS